MKKCLSIIVCLLFVTFEIIAADPFRSHKYDLFKVLPVNNESIVFIGNSITNMHEWWEAFGSDKNILNRGVWGTFINETVEHIEAVAVGKPEKVFFMIGTNDLGKNGSRNIDAIIESTRIMVERFQKVSPLTKIYIQGILPSVYNRVLEQLQETNIRLQALCEEYNITYIDLWDDLFSLTQDNTHTLDGLHMKASGYQVWTKKIEGFIGANTVYPDECAVQQEYNGIANASYAMRATIFGMLPVNEGDIVIIGDEMIHGGAWHELLRSNKVKNRGTGWGYPGPGLDVILKEIPLILNNRSGSCKPSKVLLYAGTSEINGNSSLSLIESNYRNVITKIKECAPDATLCLMGLQPTTNNNTNINRVVQFNNQLKAIADVDSKIEYIDLYSDFVSGGVASNSYFMGSYLNAFGYVKVAQKIAEALPDESLMALTDAEAQHNYHTFELRSALGNAVTVAGKLKEGNGVGEYYAEALSELNDIVDDAYLLLVNGGTDEEFAATVNQITNAVGNALKGINKPQISNGLNEYWYKLSTPNRGTRYLTSVTEEAVAIGEENGDFAKNQWKFVQRGDGMLDIVNRENGTYLNPSSAYNSGIKTTVDVPSSGWSLDYSNSPGLYVINSGTVQLNQTQSDLGWKIYNWSAGGDGRDRDDTGCQYRLELVTEDPKEVFVEPYVEFSFSRGSSLANILVLVKDESAKMLSSVSAKITVAGAESWLDSNKAYADSILCLNVNSNATTVSSPIEYTLIIDGLDENWRFKSIVFRSVALNSAGNWQGATEIRHCNFVCSYGAENDELVELPMKVDESIMVGGGSPKNVAFAVNGISPVNGKMIIKLQLYKGTNNNGCFYGLTGITLKRDTDAMTSVADIACGDMNSKKMFDLSGREVKVLGKGVYIVNGVKRVIK